jgi:hypothetical protein
VSAVALAASPTLSSATVSGLQRNKVYFFRCCAADKVGNVADGIVSAGITSA